MPHVNLRTLDLNLLRVFAAIYVERNVSLAARREHLSQPAMSNALSRLRRSFDDVLFVKIGSRMEPTERASQLAQPVLEALALLEAHIDNPGQFDPRHSARTFKLLMSDAGESAILPSLVKRAFESSDTVVRFEVVKLPHEAYATALQTGQADMAIGNLPFLKGGFERQALFDDPYCVIARDGHPLQGRRLNPSAFAQAQHVAIATGSADLLVDRHLARLRLQRSVRLQVSNYHVAADIVARSDLLATVPRMIASQAHGITILPHPLNVAAATVQMVWHAIADADPGNRWLRDMLSGLDTRPKPSQE
jgi:DNA-binding transcriptional LysR family regulator